jgi:cobalt-zinc-cadmium efflux system outer membrane protein
MVVGSLRVLTTRTSKCLCDFSLAVLVMLLLWQARQVHAAPPSPVELPAQLSLEKALELFRTRGLDLLIADAAVIGAQGDLRAAGAIPNPQLSTGFGRVFNYSTAGTPGAPCVGCSIYQLGGGLSDQAALEDSLSGKRALRLRVARAALEAARLGRSDAERTVGFQVKSQYVQVVAARWAFDFVREVQGSLEKTLELSRLRYPRVINEGDLARVEVQKLEADQSVDQAAQNLRVARVGLAFLLGVRGPVPDFEVDRDVLCFRVPAPLRTANVDTLLVDAMDHRPDLKQAASAEERAAAALALARRQRIPDVSVDTQYVQTGTGQNAIQPPTLTFGFTMALPLFYQQQGEILRAEAERETQALQRTKLVAQVVSDVETAFASFMTTKALVERMESTLLGRAKRARDITEIQYKAGSATLIDFLDAERTFIQTNVEYFGDLANFWTAIFQMEAALSVELSS